MSSHNLSYSAYPKKNNNNLSYSNVEMDTFINLFFIGYIDLFIIYITYFFIDYSNLFNYITCFPIRFSNFSIIYHHLFLYRL